MSLLVVFYWRYWDQPFLIGWFFSLFYRQKTGFGYFDFSQPAQNLVEMVENNGQRPLIF